MLDIRFIRDNQEKVKGALAAKRVEFDLQAFLDLDENRRDFLQKIENIRSQQNKINEEISLLMREKKDAQDKIAQTKQMGQELSALEEEFRPIKEEFDHKLLMLPNIPHESAPVGDVSANQIVREWGDKPSFGFKPKDHIDLAEKLGLLDF